MWNLTTWTDLDYRLWWLWLWFPEWLKQSEVVFCSDNWFVLSPWCEQFLPIKPLHTFFPALVEERAHNRAARCGFYFSVDGSKWNQRVSRPSSDGLQHADRQLVSVIFLSCWSVWMRRNTMTLRSSQKLSETIPGHSELSANISTLTRSQWQY